MQKRSAKKNQNGLPAPRQGVFRCDSRRTVAADSIEQSRQDCLQGLPPLAAQGGPCRNDGINHVGQVVILGRAGLFGGVFLRLNLARFGGLLRGHFQNFGHNRGHNGFWWLL